MYITDTDWSIKSINPVSIDLLIHYLLDVQRTQFQLYSGREVTFPIFKILISMTHRLLKFRRLIHSYIQILHLNLNCRKYEKYDTNIFIIQRRIAEIWSGKSNIARQE